MIKRSMLLHVTMTSHHTSQVISKVGQVKFKAILCKLPKHSNTSLGLYYKSGGMLSIE